jgi:hypothetical protein
MVAPFKNQTRWSEDKAGVAVPTFSCDRRISERQKSSKAKKAGGEITASPKNAGEII